MSTLFIGDDFRYYAAETVYVETPEEIKADHNGRMVVLADVNNMEGYEKDGNFKHFGLDYNKMQFDSSIKGARIWKPSPQNKIKGFRWSRTALALYLIKRTRKGIDVRVAFHRRKGTCNPVGVVDVHPRRLWPVEKRARDGVKRSIAIKRNRDADKRYQKEMAEYLLGERKERPKRQLTPKARARILKAYEATGSLKAAASIGNMEEKDLLKLMDVYPKFATNMVKAKEKFVARLEQQAIELATGFDRMIYHRGKIIGKERVVNDKVLLKLLAVHDPERWSDKPAQTTVNINQTVVDPSDSAKTKLGSLLGLDSSLMIEAQEKEAIREVSVDDFIDKYDLIPTEDEEDISEGEYED